MARAVLEGDSGEEKSSGGARKQSPPPNWLTNFHRDLTTGAVMGGVVHTIVAPIERAKLLLQTQESNIAILAGGPHRRFKGMMDCIVRTVREEGILSLWRGNGSSVIRYYPSVALNFSLKLSVRDKVTRPRVFWKDARRVELKPTSLICIRRDTL